MKRALDAIHRSRARIGLVRTLFSFLPRYVVYRVFLLGLARKHDARELADDFDARHGTDTSAMVDLFNLEGVTEQQLGAYCSYQPTPAGAVRRGIELLERDVAGAVFVDIGCGKGRTLLAASDYAWKAIVGVEFAPALCTIARKNLTTYRSETQRCTALSVHCGPAEDYALPPEDLVLFFCTPFTAEIMRPFLDSVHAQLTATPRKLALLFFGIRPDNLALVESLPWLTRYMPKQAMSEIDHRTFHIFDAR